MGAASPRIAHRGAALTPLASPSSVPYSWPPTLRLTQTGTTTAPRRTITKADPVSDTMRTWLTICLLVVLAVGATHARPQPPPRHVTDAEPFLTLARRDATRTQLIDAMAKLPLPVSEPPTYWSRIANDSRYTTFQRWCAVYQLFRRHVHVGLRLSELAALLDRPTWLRRDGVITPSVITGEPHIRTLPGTVLILCTRPDLVWESSGRTLHLGPAQGLRPIVGSRRYTADVDGDPNLQLIPSLSGPHAGFGLLLRISGRHGSLERHRPEFTDLILQAKHTRVADETILEAAIDQPW